MRRGYNIRQNKIIENMRGYDMVWDKMIWHERRGEVNIGRGIREARRGDAMRREKKKQDKREAKRREDNIIPYNI